MDVKPSWTRLEFPAGEEGGGLRTWVDPGARSQYGAFDDNHATDQIGCLEYP